MNNTTTTSTPHSVGRFEADAYRAHLLYQGLEDRTVRTYSQYAVRWARWALTEGHAPLLPDAEKVREWSHTLPTSASTRKNARVALSHLCDWCGVSDCSAAVARPMKKARRLRMPLSRSEAAQLMAYAHTCGMGGTAVIIALTTGMRISELRHLHWLDIDWRSDTVEFWRTKTRDRHTVPLSKLLADRLEVERPDDPERAGHVLGKSDGGRRSDQSMRDWIDRVTEGAGLGWVQPHDLRRTAGRAVYEQSGRDITVAQRFLGHASPKQTSVYIRVDLDGVRDSLGDGWDYYELHPEDPS